MTWADGLRPAPDPTSARPTPAREARPGDPDPLGGPSPAAWCSGVSKTYRRRRALTSVELRVERGEVLGLLGPNGAGKTSLIKILLGLVRPDAGEVMLLGRPGGGHASRVRVGYLPELFRYQPWLAADEVLRLHARLAGVPAASSERDRLLALVGLEGRARDRVSGFSKGMQQRLGLAVALLGDPELVVLDEPTSALDPIGRVDVREIVRDLRERGTAVLLNSHLIGEVERVCDRVVILDHGQVAAEGTLDELLGEAEVRLRLGGVDTAALALMAGFGTVTQAGEWVTVQGLDGSRVPELVAGLVGLHVRVYAVEPGRMSLEERLLDVLRADHAEPERQQVGVGS